MIFFSTFQLQESQRTVQGLVTPQRIPNLNRPVSPKIIPLANTVSIDTNEGLGDAESSDSYSSTSYASAVGSQEDFTLVDLHMQVNRLIVDSPMLMSSYVTHLSQNKCSNWGAQPKHSDQFSVPLFEKNQDGKLVYVGMLAKSLILCTTNMYYRG